MNASCRSASALEVPPRRRALAPGRRHSPSAGHDAVHTRDVGLTSATDPVVLGRALDEGRVLLTLDTDFGALLAHSGGALPSVVLFRGDVTRRPEGLASLLLANLDQFEPDLDQGALVVIGDGRLRIRSLPI